MAPPPEATHFNETLISHISQCLLLGVHPEGAEKPVYPLDPHPCILEAKQEIPIYRELERNVDCATDTLPRPPTPKQGFLRHPIHPPQHAGIVPGQDPPADFSIILVD